MRSQRPSFRALVQLVAAVAAFAFSLIVLEVRVGYTSPMFGLALMCCVLGISATGRPFFRLRVPRRMRELRAWERSGDVYRLLGVPAFGELLRGSPLRLLNSHVYFSRRQRNPGAVLLELQSAEAAHFWAALVLVPYLVYGALHRQLETVALVGMVQVACNIYPILHLRSVRNRLERIAVARATTATDITSAIDVETPPNESLLRPINHDESRAATRRTDPG